MATPPICTTMLRLPGCCAIDTSADSARTRNEGRGAHHDGFERAERRVSAEDEATVDSRSARVRGRLAVRARRGARTPFTRVGGDKWLENRIQRFATASRPRAAGATVAAVNSPFEAGGALSR